MNLSGNNLPATIRELENKWKLIIPSRPFNYYFVDDAFNKQYASEERFGKLFLYFAVLAIIISCLGLLGLASYSTLQRTREIGIRKVLGASIPGIVAMLSKEFLKLILTSLLVAFPLVWFSMNKWLLNFEYRTSIEWNSFFVAGFIAIIIAIITISFQAIKAAVANPVKSLRTE